jgi:hypothetical protein
MAKTKKPDLDMDKIARGLGAQRTGTVSASGGHFGALQLVADVQARFQVPRGGGRRTDPSWTERRLIPLSRRTLRRLEQITATAQKRDGLNIGPLQVAGLLLERMTEQLSIEQAENLVRPPRVQRRTRARS